MVDNASEDRTVEVVQPLLEDPRVRLLRNDVNRGKGFSVRRGMLEARGELRLLCDADCAASLDSLPRMLDAMEAVDVVSGSRVAEGADVGLQQSFRRRLVGWPFIALTRGLMARAHARRLLRLQALARGGGRGRVPAAAPGRLGLRRRGAGAGAPARLSHHARWA